MKYIIKWVATYIQYADDKDILMLYQKKVLVLGFEYSTKVLVLGLEFSCKTVYLYLYLDS